MLTVLFLQVASLLPPLQPWPKERDPAYLEAVVEVAKGTTLSAAQRQHLQPQTDAQRAELGRLLQTGNRRQVRLCALLCTAHATRFLGAALLHRMAVESDAATALACLLAVSAPSAAQLPALAYLVQDQERSLAVRAAAAGMLLQQERLGVWPWCRSLFRSGTAGDEKAPWADWPRGSRWELPKRLLLMALDRYLQSKGKAPSGFEPNAAWEAQLLQLASLEPRLQKLRGSLPAPPAVDPSSPKFLAEKRLLQLALDGDPQARLAVPWLMPQFRPTLLAALRSDQQPLVDLARRLLAEMPQ